MIVASRSDLVPKAHESMPALLVLGRFHET
jgi:hypothetical protein